MLDVKVEGADQLQVLGRRLKETADRELRKELLAGLNRATRPVKAKVKASARATLPKRGGLNEVIAGAKVSSTNRLAGKNVGVRVTGKLSGHDLDAIDRGRLRHPVFGNRNVWVTQEIAPGFFTDVMEAEETDVRRALVDVLDEVERKLPDGG